MTSNWYDPNSISVPSFNGYLPKTLVYVPFLLPKSCTKYLLFKCPIIACLSYIDTYKLCILLFFPYPTVKAVLWITCIPKFDPP